MSGGLGAYERSDHGNIFPISPAKARGAGNFSPCYGPTCTGERAVDAIAVLGGKGFKYVR